MATVPLELQAHREWLGQIQQVGLVVSPQVLVNNGIFIDRRVSAEVQTQLRSLAGEHTLLPFLEVAKQILAWPDALYWSDLNRCPERSGSWYSLHRRHDRSMWENERQTRKLRRPDAEAWYRARQQGIDTTSVANRAIRRASRLSA